MRKSGREIHLLDIYTLTRPPFLSSWCLGPMRKKNYHFIIGHAHALLTSKCPSRPPCARDRRNRKGEDLYERKINAVQVFRSADIINKTYIFVSVYLKAEGYIELNASDRPFQTLIFDDGAKSRLYI